MKNRIYYILPFFFGLYACQNSENGFDASGVFEATEIVVSAEANGVVQEFPYEEGESIEEGVTMVVIENTNLELQKEQVEETLKSISQKTNDPGPQISVLEKQLSTAKSNVAVLKTQLEILSKEQTRINNLLLAKAATSQQKDDIDGKVKVLDKQIELAESNVQVISSQIESTRRQVDIQNRGIISEKKPIEKQIDQLDYQIKKARVINPVSGTILTKYAYEGEFVNIGKPLYRIADLKVMELRAYITGDQLSKVKIGEEVAVFIDKDKESYYEYKGTISWISDKAEFTPKSIQMKDERANLVYAMKVKVPNDGKIKIGMYGEISFAHSVIEHE